MELTPDKVIVDGRVAILLVGRAAKIANGYTPRVRVTWEKDPPKNG